MPEYRCVAVEVMMGSQSDGQKRQWFSGVIGGLTLLATLLTGVGALFGIYKTIFTGPRVVDFSAEPDTLRPGETLVLNWIVDDADRVVITPQVGEVPLQGRRTLHPDRSLQYVLTAEKGLQKKVVSLNVAVERPAEPPLPPVPAPAPVGEGPATEARSNEARSNEARSNEARSNDGEPAESAPQARLYEGEGELIDGLPLDSPPRARVSFEPAAPTGCS